MLAAITLLPALLGFAGRNIDQFGLPPPQAGRGRRRASRSGTAGAASSSAARGRRSSSARRAPARARAPGALDAPRLRRRRQPHRHRHDARGPTTCSPRASAPGFNGPILLAAETPGRRSRTSPRSQELSDDARTRPPGVAVRHAVRSRTTPATPRSCRSSRRRRPQDEETTDLVDTAARRRDPRRDRRQRHRA